MIEVYVVFSFIFLIAALIMFGFRSIIYNCLGFAFATLGLFIYSSASNSYMIACATNATCDKAAFITTMGLSQALVWVFTAAAILNLLVFLVKVILMFNKKQEGVGR